MPVVEGLGGAQEPIRGGGAGGYNVTHGHALRMTVVYWPNENLGPFYSLYHGRDSL